MDQRDSDLKSLIGGITALTEDLKPVENIGRYNRLHGRRQKLIFALLNHESSEAGLTQLLNHEDAALRGIGSFAQGLFEAKGTAAAESRPARRKLFPFEPLPPKCSRAQAETLIRNAL